MLENIDNKATRGSISQIILKALSLGDKYGYEICKDIEKLSNGKLVLKQPSLYSCLRRMEEQKLISSYWKDSLLGGRRHYYSITERGKQLYEDNKNIWKDDDELLKSLPGSNAIAKEKNNKDNIEKDSAKTDTPLSADISSQQKPINSLYVLDQENLFNLVRKKDKEIKKINTNNDNNDENKSFLQFDFFEQNIKFVKKNNINCKEDISVFTNKFSNMDNHSQDIEPEDSLLSNEEQPNTSRISLSSILDKEIKREGISSFNENSSTSTEQKESKKTGSIFDYMKSATAETELNETSINKDLDIFNISQNSNINKDIQSKNMANTNCENKLDVKQNFIPSVSNDFDDITWEKTEYGDAPLFDHDYKSAIGKLYNNSQLKDPYEQNKFQTFKEIFPSSTLKEKEKKEIRQTKIDAVIQSSSNSNIDCEDIKMLNNLYNLQGLNIKIHNNIENKAQNKIYKDKNKLNMICAWLVTFIGLAEFIVSFLLLDNNSLFLKHQGVIYICCSAILLFSALTFTMKNFFDRYKLITIKKNFTKDIIVSLLIFILFIVATFAINISLGMSSLSQVEHLSYWLIPCLLFSNILLAQGVYAILLKIKYFDS